MGGPAMITIAIPTFNRQEIAVETIVRLLPFGAPIIVVDQTPAAYEPLASLPIRLIRLPEPSIPHAMNIAVDAAATDLVLFLDDDVIPSPSLLDAHAAAHRDAAVWVVVGQILQPGERPQHIEQPADDLEFHFNSDAARAVTNVMAGNLSVKRSRFIALGGFDENFVGVAYRFESDFALRVAHAGGKILFEPRASIDHLKLPTGGLRSYGDHRTSASPMHSAGDYYFALCHRPPLWRYALRRLRANVLTRFHAKHPWTIPAKLAGELRGLVLARRLHGRGRRLGMFTSGEHLGTAHDRWS
ncbi:MAG TPA: glycosyltransferase [Thermoanaerobaculia bacterium]|jgi:GT2 family glycosyltransferase